MKKEKEKEEEGGGDDYVPTASDLNKKALSKLSSGNKKSTVLVNLFTMETDLPEFLSTFEKDTKVIPSKFFYAKVTEKSLVTLDEDYADLVDKQEDLEARITELSAQVKKLEGKNKWLIERSKESLFSVVNIEMENENGGLELQNGWKLIDNFFTWKIILMRNLQKFKKGDIDTTC